MMDTQTRNEASNVWAQGVAQSVPETFPDDLYFIRCGKAVKIGRAKCVNTRLRTAQTYSPKKLELVASWHGMGWNEKVWHRAFAEHRLEGEWFAFVPEIRTAIKAATSGESWIGTLGPSEGWSGRAKAEWMENPAEFERVFGTEDNYALRMRRGEIADFEERLADKCGAEVDYEAA